MTRTFILLCTGVFAIAYALYELKHMGVYYPDASNPQLFTGWKAVTELGPAIGYGDRSHSVLAVAVHFVFQRLRVPPDTERDRQV